MKQCPICEQNNDSSATKCDCGFNFETGQIGDQVNFRKGLKWHEKVTIKRKIHEFQRKTFGNKISTSREAKGWSKRMTAKLLNESPSAIVQDIALAEALQSYPELRNCKTKSKANKLYKEIQKASSVKENSFAFENEEELQTYLEINWDKTPLGPEWELKKSKYNTQEIGVIDLLAHHRKDSRWLVIELKKDQSSDETIGQLLRYMGYIKCKIASPDEKVEGLIISRSVDNQILYALVCTSNIKFQRYIFDGKKLELKEVKINVELMLSEIRKLRPEDRKKIIEYLENENCSEHLT